MNLGRVLTNDELGNTFFFDFFIKLLYNKYRKLRKRVLKMFDDFDTQYQIDDFNSDYFSYPSMNDPLYYDDNSWGESYEEER